MPIDYEILRIIWWVLLGLLLIGFAVMDGFDLGVGALLKWVARSDDERRVVINTIGPVWEGNQIWLVLGGGAIFAAWPMLYAVSFSGFYFAMLLVLLTLIIRPVAFKYRSKLTNTFWRKMWDDGICFGSLICALVFGVAVGNVLQGVPFYFDETMRSIYTGSFWQLLNPFALLCGLLSVAMLIMHGANFLVIKTEGKIQLRARYASQLAAFFSILLFVVAGFFISRDIKGYIVSSEILLDGPSNPFNKTVLQSAGSWLQNYGKYPWFILAPIIGLLGAAFSYVMTSLNWPKLAWFFSALAIAGIISTVGFSMYPFLLPSSSHPEMSLLIWDASSSQLTLFVMLIATIIFLPIILLYTAWVYRVMRGKVTTQYVNDNKDNVY